jgi:hypothetical protein
MSSLEFVVGIDFFLVQPEIGKPYHPLPVCS